MSISSDATVSARMFRRPERALLLVSALVGACYTLKAPAPPLHPYNPPGAWYILQPGETLEQLATRAAVPVEDLREINGLRPSDPVQPGRLLYVLYGEKGVPVSRMKRRRWPPSKHRRCRRLRKPAGSGGLWPARN
jgi:hypothetical protein